MNRAKDVVNVDRDPQVSVSQFIEQIGELLRNGWALVNTISSTQSVELYPSLHPVLPIERVRVVGTEEEKEEDVLEKIERLKKIGFELESPSLSNDLPGIRMIRRRSQ
jgi:hypothetical protein